MKGIQRCAEAVGITMGTAGLNSILEAIPNPGYDLTNDGITILESIKFADPLEELGRRILLEAVSKANKSSGDGSSTTTVLCAAILEEGIKHLGETSAMEIKRSLEACIPVIEDSIKKQAREITVDEVWKAAAISAEDESIGKRIGEIYQKIGKDGVINWEAAKVPEDSYEIGTGIKINDSGFVTPYLNDVDASTGWFKNEARMKDVSVILCAQKLTNLNALGGLLELLNDKGESDVAIFVDEVTPEVIGQLIATRQKRGFRAVLIKMPTLWRNEWWEDLSLASGATVISNAIGVPLNSIEEKHVGRFGNVIVGKDEVVVDGTKDLKKHISALQVNGDDDSMRRAVRLNLKTARYFVGGHSETSISHRRRKIEDAINAASEALDGGVVAGGGVALLNVANELGNDILVQALKKPFRQIVKNTGLHPSYSFENIQALEAKKVIESIKKGGAALIPIDGKIEKISEESSQWLIENESGGNKGFDSKTGEIVDMFEAGIVDPAKVLSSAVKAAIGVAAGVLTLGTVVLLPKEEENGNMRESLIRR